MPKSFLIRFAHNYFNMKGKMFRQTSLFFLLLLPIFFIGCSAKVPFDEITVANWPTNLSNTSRTNSVDADLILPPLKIWSKNISTFYNNNLRWFPKKETTSPVIYDNILYVGSSLNHFSAIDLLTKDKLWRFKTSFPVEASATVSDDAVVFGTTGGVLYALGRHEGNFLWEFYTNSAILSSPLVNNGVVYVLSLNNKVSAIDINSGESLWTYGQFTLENIFRRHKTSITLGEKNIFVVSNEGYLLSINKENGLELWKEKLIDNVINADSARTTPMYIDGVIYVIDGDGAVLGFDELSGNVVSKFEYDKAKDFIIRDNNIYISTAGEIKAYTLSGLPLWNYLIDKESTAISFAATSEYILFSYNMKSWMTRKVNLGVLDISDGELVWSKRFSEPSQSDIAVSDSRVVLTVTDGTLYVMNTNYLYK